MNGDEKQIDMLADMHTEFDRRIEGLSDRVRKLEAATRFGARSDEERLMYLSIAAYILIQFVLPALVELVKRWRE